MYALDIDGENGEKQHDFKLNSKSDGEANCSSIQEIKMRISALIFLRKVVVSWSVMCRTNRNKDFITVKSRWEVPPPPPLR